MRFYVFHLMPWPYLPEDFAQTHDTAWVICENDLSDPVLGHELYNRYLDQLELADQLGFDGICVNEHHQNAYGLMPSPNIMAACLARRTTNAKLVMSTRPTPASGFRKRTSSSFAPGPSRAPLAGRASTIASATSTSGRSRTRSRTRRSGFRA